MDFKSLQKHIKSKEFKPVYLLHGEEPYYIDVLSKLFQEYVLEEHERDFNETIVYGKEADVFAIMAESKGFPLMAERRLVLVREAQELKNIDELESYIENPNPSTVLVLAHKYKKVDARKKFGKLIPKVGVVFTSDKVRDYQLVDWITSYLSTTEYKITSKAAILLADSLGNDLSRIKNELDKLSLLLEKGTTINEVHIEENIGISKDYNMFELNNAVSTQDYLKAMKIVNYFEHNPKSGLLVPIIGGLYNLFSQLMKIHFLDDKSQNGVASALKVHPFVAGELVKATRLYNPKMLAANVSLLYEYDLKSKGIGNSSFSDSELLSEMIFRLMHH